MNIMSETVIPKDEQLKRDLVSKFTANTSYLGSEVKKEILASDFKQLREREIINKPSFIKKGDVILSYEGKKSRPAIVIKVLKDRTILFIPLTSTENIHCMTPFKSRFFNEGCFSKSFNVCTEEYAIENFIGVFDNTKALNQAIKDLKTLINTNL